MSLTGVSEHISLCKSGSDSGVTYIVGVEEIDNLNDGDYTSGIK